MSKKNRKYKGNNKEHEMGDLKERLLKESVEAAKKKAEADAKKAEEEKEKADSDKKEKDAAEEVEKVEGTVEDAEKADDSAEKTETADEGAEGELSPDVDATSINAKGEGDKKDAKIAELNDRLIRNLAEFDNYRKRTDKEKSQMFEMGAKSIIEKILPAIDSFELGMAAMNEEDKASGVGQGMEKIYKQLMTILEGAGVKQIEALGKEFDPNLHNAVMHEENEEFGENTVSQELQKGYMYNDSVICHSMVKVAN